MKIRSTTERIHRMVGTAILTAIVIVLQLLGSFIKFGPVSISLVLIPIVVGAAMYGPSSGAFLGFVFSIVVLLQPDTAWFYSISYFGTVATVLLKGTLAGFLAGLVYRLLSKTSHWLAVFAAAIVCPIVNTGIFALGCWLFFWNSLPELTGDGSSAVAVLFVVLIGFHFIAEFVTNLICSPLIVRILHAVKRK